MEFIPETPKMDIDIPYYDDVKAEAGWQGHGTSKSIETLKSEVQQALANLGGLVVGFQRGLYKEDNQIRAGIAIHYTIEATDGSMFPGRIDVAALPVRKPKRIPYNKTEREVMQSREEKSLKMALFNVRDALKSQFNLSMLSPGYAPLMPWMIAKGDKTIGQLWAESPMMKQLLPPSGSDFIEGEVKEV
jgi:hypothetical protein